MGQVGKLLEMEGKWGWNGKEGKGRERRGESGRRET